MSRGRVLTVLLGIWLLALAIVLQPHNHAGVVISHARALDAPARNLPTLTPLSP